METHASILAWKIPWTEDLVGYNPWGRKRVGHHWAHTHTLLFFKVAQLCPTLCNHMDYTVHGNLQARILEWVAVRFSRGSSQPRDQTQVSHIAGWFFISWATREAPEYWNVGSLSLLQQIILTQKLNWVLLHCRRILYQLSFQGSPSHTYIYSIIRVFRHPLRELGMYPPQIRGNDCTRISACFWRGKLVRISFTTVPPGRLFWHSISLVQRHSLPQIPYGNLIWSE